MRLHICWGSGHGPHRNDIPLEDIVDVVLKVRAECYSVEAANPRHEYEWHVWRGGKLPEGKALMPGVVGHATNVIEHPGSWRERLVRYAGSSGVRTSSPAPTAASARESGIREIAWAKLESLVEGARLATKELWGR